MARSEEEDVIQRRLPGRCHESLYENSHDLLTAYAPA